MMITPVEKQLLYNKVTNAFNEFIGLLSSFDEQNLNHVPFAGSWTPAQVASHIILATDGVPDGKTITSDRPFDAYLPMIRPWWENFNEKLKSPEPLQPSGKPRVKDELLSELRRVLKKDQAIIMEKDLTVICLNFEIPTIGYLTRYEWLLFIEIHLRRHSFQLKNMVMDAKNRI